MYIHSLTERMDHLYRGDTNPTFILLQQKSMRYDAVNDDETA